MAIKFSSIWYLALTCVLCGSVQAQSIQVLVNKAGRQLNSGNLEDAAFLYERAGRLKGGKNDAMVQAGNCYFRLRNYEKAADCYRSAASLAEKDAKAGLQYGRSLKQCGRYPEAAEVFKSFARNYQGDFKAQLVSIVQQEIRGCDLGIALGVYTDSVQVDTLTQLDLLPAAINTDDIEIAPIPFSDKLLYFVVVGPEGNYLMRSIRKENVWQKAERAEGLPAAISKRFGSGAFSPDGKRFYCTQCTALKRSKEQIRQGIALRCEIYQTHRTEEGWSEPVRLPEYINLAGTSVMHPFVTQTAGKEILYFSSDRPGTLGGLDLYRTERSLRSDTLDFSLPQNLGRQINTWGDEVSPFVDNFTQTLWFSSNGHPGIGGLDIFKTIWEEGSWMPPQNAGLPFNSPADDLFMVLKKNGNGGYLVSNRLFGEQRTHTISQDIFEFLPIYKE
jgi:hypothetical protein